MVYDQQTTKKKMEKKTMRKTTNKKTNIKRTKEMGKNRENFTINLSQEFREEGKMSETHQGCCIPSGSCNYRI